MFKLYVAIISIYIKMNRVNFTSKKFENSAFNDRKDFTTARNLHSIGDYARALFFYNAATSGRNKSIPVFDAKNIADCFIYLGDESVIHQQYDTAARNYMLGIDYIYHSIRALNFWDSNRKVLNKYLDKYPESCFKLLSLFIRYLLQFIT